jgi:(2Fe-2S) ferredoxin
VSKHPDVDHVSQLAELGEAVDAVPGASLTVKGCLGRCMFSNLVVVRPPLGGLVWIGGVLSPEVTTELGQWIRSGTGVTGMAGLLAAHVVHDGTVRTGAA